MKTLIRLGIRPVWPESSQSAPWVAKDPSFLLANSEDSDQMPRRTFHFIGFVMHWLIFKTFCHPSSSRVMVDTTVILIFNLSINTATINMNIFQMGVRKKVNHLFESVSSDPWPWDQTSRLFKYTSLIQVGVVVRDVITGIIHFPKGC